MKIIHIYNDMHALISTSLTFLLAISLANLLSILASVLAVVWWIFKFYDRYKNK